MKPRKVMVHLELRSNIPIRNLQNKEDWNTLIENFFYYDGKTEVHQVSVQVVKEGK